MRLSEFKTAKPKGEKIPTAIKSKANKALDALGKTYHNGVPLDKAQAALKKLGVILLQEDNTEYSGWLAGRKGRATIDIAPAASKSGEFYTPYANSVLAVTWHKMDSGKFEFVAYLS